MATVTLKGNPINTIGALPEPGSKAPGFSGGFYFSKTACAAENRAIGTR